MNNQAAQTMHPDALPDGTLSKSTVKRVTALAAASVSERNPGAEHAMHWIDRYAAGIDEVCQLDRVEQALTQQRGDDVESVARALFEAQADRLAAPWDRQWEPTKEHWRKVARGNLYATTPQPSADAVREIYDAAAKGFHTSETNGAERKYLHVIRFQSIEDLHGYEDAWTAAMVKARDAK